MQVTRGVQKAAYKVVVYGPEGIGKTTFASRFPDPVFIDTEGSTDTMDVARLPRPTSWEELLAEVDAVASGEVPCGTLVIDTADWAERLCIAAVCRNARVSGIEDIGYGKGYVYVQEALGGLLDKLEALTRKGIHAVVTAHAMMRKFEQPDELGAYDRWELKLSKKAAPLLKEWSDILLFANYRTHVTVTKEGKRKAVGGERVMYAAHHACWDAKNRCGLPDEMPFDYGEIREVIEGAGAARGNGNPLPAAAAATLPGKPGREKKRKTSSPPQFTGEGPGEGTDVPAGGGKPDAQAAEERKSPPADAAPPQSPAENARSGTEEDPAAWAGIPGSLAALMRRDGISPFELRAFVAAEGFYPMDTPFDRYDPAFLDTYLPSVWETARARIETDRDEVPF